MPINPWEGKFFLKYSPITEFFFQVHKVETVDFRVEKFRFGSFEATIEPNATLQWLPLFQSALVKH